MRAALAELGVDLDRLRKLEPDAALGNGGLGRLAACFMESMATLSASPPTATASATITACSARSSRTAGSTNIPENWLAFGNPWEFERPESPIEIGFGGSVERDRARPDGTTRYVWQPAETVDAVAYDTPVVGWRGQRVNTLRLWSARAADPMRLDAFNPGDHVGALAERGAGRSDLAGALSRATRHPAGQELRLRQEYFFSSASLQDLVRRHIAASTATSARCPTRRRSSSTTRIRPSPSPS